MQISDLCLSASVSSSEATDICPPGYYCPEGTETHAQYPCPNGTYNDQWGITAEWECKNCTQGTRMK